MKKITLEEARKFPNFLGICQESMVGPAMTRLQPTFLGGKVNKEAIRNRFGKEDNLYLCINDKLVYVCFLEEDAYALWFHDLNDLTEEDLKEFQELDHFFKENMEE